MANIAALCGQLGSSDQIEAFHARSAMKQLVASAGSPGMGATRREVATAIAGELAATHETSAASGDREVVGSPRHSARARNAMCEYLSLVADEPEVPALRRALDDFAVREMARWCLSRMTCQEATDALVEAARSGVGVEFRIGVIASLGSRRGSQVVEALTECVNDADGEVRVAAAEALARQGVPGLAEVFARALAKQGRATSGNRLERRVNRAQLDYGCNLLAEGHEEAAREVLSQLANANEVDEPQRRAAQAALDSLS